MLKILAFTLCFFIWMTDCTLAQQVPPKSVTTQHKMGCTMTNKLFLQMITYAGSDLLMAIPKTFQSIVINKDTYHESPLIFFILIQKSDMLLPDSVESSKEEYPFDSTISFHTRWVRIKYRDKRRQRLFGGCELEVWSFKDESKAIEVFSFLSTDAPHGLVLFTADFYYVRMGRNIFILSVAQPSNAPVMKKLMHVIEQKYTCLGEVEHEKNL
ncbi:hypothetical protein [Xanthocytophaga flava]|uniref:hypothetical protein n=1 Tax=Xanthocytophaga flava TaxID=3048013 RepID=UPI0028D7F338|nr:hypothetical protein [Xanthocytophaga flavus]MDJ1466488.1 hypothetical protein [Xanthocytophaga flavus]